MRIVEPNNYICFYSFLDQICIDRTVLLLLPNLLPSNFGKLDMLYFELKAKR